MTRPPDDGNPGMVVVYVVAAVILALMAVGALVLVANR